MVNLDKKTLCALRGRDFVQQEAVAQQEGPSASAAEEARGAYETNFKQVQAAANFKYKARSKQVQEERNVERQGDGLGGEHYRAAAHDESHQCCCSCCQQGERCGCLRARSAGPRSGGGTKRMQATLRGRRP
eukprot:4601323-Pleurochrysis_carterae.AAC.1